MFEKRFLFTGVFFLLLLVITGFFTSETAFSAEVGSPYLVKKGQIQPEIDWVFNNFRNGDRSASYYYSLHYGVSDRFQATVTIPYQYFSPARGASTYKQGDTGFDFRYFIQDDTRYSPAMTVKFNCDLNDNGDIIPAGYFLADYGISLYTLKKFPGNWNIRTVIGQQFSAFDNDNNFNYSGSVLKNVGKWQLETGVIGVGYLKRPGYMSGFVATSYIFSDDVSFSPAYKWGVNKHAPKNGWEVDLCVTF